jgi:hypothetical protein
MSHGPGRASATSRRQNDTGGFASVPERRPHSGRPGSCRCSRRGRTRGPCRSRSGFCGGAARAPRRASVERLALPLRQPRMLYALGRGSGGCPSRHQPTRRSRAGSRGPADAVRAVRLEHRPTGPSRPSQEGHAARLPQPPPRRGSRHPGLGEGGLWVAPGCHVLTCVPRVGRRSLCSASTDREPILPRVPLRLRRESALRQVGGDSMRRCVPGSAPDSRHVASLHHGSSCAVPTARLSARRRRGARGRHAHRSGVCGQAP